MLGGLNFMRLRSPAKIEIPIWENFMEYAAKNLMRLH